MLMCVCVCVCVCVRATQGGTNAPYYIHFPVSPSAYFNNTLHMLQAKKLRCSKASSKASSKARSKARSKASGKASEALPRLL